MSLKLIEWGSGALIAASVLMLPNPELMKLGAFFGIIGCAGFAGVVMRSSLYGIATINLFIAGVYLINIITKT